MPLQTTRVSKTASYGKAFGQPLKHYGLGQSEISFAFEYDEIVVPESFDENLVSQLAEVQTSLGLSADDMLTAKDILSTVNGARYSAARAKAQADSFEQNGIKKPGVLQTDEGKLAHFVKGFMALGNSEADATAMAKQVLGIQ